MMLMHSKQDNGEGSRTTVRRASVRAVLLLFCWWVLTQGDPASWVIGLPTVLLATSISLRLSTSSPCAWRLGAFFRFIPFFAYYSLKGGVDVASRAFHPSLPVAPTMLNYLLRLPAGAARVFLANVISLLPGTLSADLRGDTLVVHVLDGNVPAAKQLQYLEARVARLFGYTVASENAEGTEK